MPLNIPTFFTRLGSSIVFVAIMLTGLLWNEWSFLGLVCLINFLCLREFFRLMQKVDKETYLPKWIPVSVVLASELWLFLFFGPLIRTGFDFRATISLIAVPFAIAFTACFMLVAVLSKHTAWRAAMQSVFGVVYIVLPMSLFLCLYKTDSHLPLLTMLLIWTNDTAAYLVGSFFGKTPFSPVSPKKTWEGVIGATILTMGISIALSYYLPVRTEITRFGWITYGAIGLVVSVAGPAGDLFKSKFKRIADVKDTGNILPGHGGALDRFDSLLMVIPFIYFVLYIIGLIWFKGH